MENLADGKWNISFSVVAHVWRSPSWRKNKTLPLIFQAYREVNDYEEQRKEESLLIFHGKCLRRFGYCCSWGQNFELTLDFPERGHHNATRGNKHCNTRIIFVFHLKARIKLWNAIFHLRKRSNLFVFPCVPLNIKGLSRDFSSLSLSLSGDLDLKIHSLTFHFENV